jgi:hypothetical protein
MSAANLSSALLWPLWKKVLFRFFFIYLVLLIAPWSALGAIPGAEFITHYFDDFNDWIIRTANKSFLHIRSELVPTGASGDTSWGWAEQWLYTILAALGCLIWSVLDRKRSNYSRLNYWNCLFIRFSLSSILFGYGISKLLILQMPFPSLSRLATPLGNYTPMRFFWLLMGYSQPYEFFSGVMEVVAALFLVYRRTATLGTILAFVVFVNIAMLNLSYDICVKLFSIQLVVNCVYLLANEKDRLLNFFVFNKTAGAGGIYQFPYKSRKMRIARIAMKLFFAIFILGASITFNWGRYKTAHTATIIEPLKMGIYEVTTFAVNKDTLPPLLTDTMRWQDLILDGRNTGSINTSDPIFRQEYGRAYFSYKVDSSKQLLQIKKNKSDSIPLISFRYKLINENTLLLFGKHNNDSLFLSIKRSPKRYQLPDNDFHWLMETPS